MSALKKHSLTIVVAIIVAIVTFLASYLYLPREAKAPATSTEAAPTKTTPATTPAPSANIPADAVVIPVSIVSIEQIASSSPTVTVEYPQFPSLSAAFNGDIASATLSRLAQFRQDVSDSQAERAKAGDPSAILPPSAYSFSATWQAAQIDSRYVSLVERYDEYSGGADEFQDLQTFNYDLSTHAQVSLASLFPGRSDYLSTISTQVRQQLTASMNASSNGNVSTDMLDAGTTADADNFSDFTFTDNSVTFYFPQCAVAACSFGEQDAMVSRAQ